MGPKTTAAISGGMGGALVGAITGWLVDEGTGAGIGALVGGTAMALVGISAAEGMSSGGTGTGGIPKGVGRAVQAPVRRVLGAGGAINSQLMPARAGVGTVYTAINPAGKGGPGNGSWCSREVCTVDYAGQTHCYNYYYRC